MRPLESDEPIGILPTDGAIVLGALGLEQLPPLSPEVEAILSEPPDVGKVEVKPTGQAYMPHAEYTRLLNRAFGRGQWVLVPAAQPVLKSGVMILPYVLYVHGRRVAFAFGEQKWSEKNPEQTQGDAIESTVASAMRRATKHLGIWTELWDRRWLRKFEAEYVVKVKVLNRKDEEDTWFRRKDDPPFWQEEKYQRTHGGGRRSDRQSAPPATMDPPAPPARSYQPPAGEITPDQVRRLGAILSASGRDKTAVAAWLAVAYPYTGGRSVTIAKRDYDAICAAIESSRPLPQPAREPGEDG